MLSQGYFCLTNNMINHMYVLSIIVLLKKKKKKIWTCLIKILSIYSSIILCCFPCMLTFVLTIHSALAILYLFISHFLFLLEDQNSLVFYTGGEWYYVLLDFLDSSQPLLLQNCKNECKLLCCIVCFTWHMISKCERPHQYICSLYLLLPKDNYSINEKSNDEIQEEHACLPGIWLY